MMRPAWKALIDTLDLCPATRNFATGLELQRLDNGVIHLKSADHVTRSAVDKLAVALSRHTEQPVALVLRHGRTSAIHRSYTDQRGSAEHARP